MPTARVNVAKCDIVVLVKGREDMDVRMLGDGRPFIMDIQNQRADMPDLEFFSSVQDQLQKVHLQEASFQRLLCSRVPLCEFKGTKFGVSMIH